MEDLSGDVGKKVTRPVKPKPRRRSAGWTLLFVGGQGKVIRVRRFKGFMITWMVSSIIALTAAAGLGYFYYDKSIQTEALEDALISSRKKMKALQDEKDILLTRVVVAESNRRQGNEGASATSEKETVSKKEAPKKATETPPHKPSEKIEVNPSTAVSAATGVDDDPEEEAEPKSPPDISESPITTDPATQVTVDDFFSIVEPEGNRLRVKYKIRNVDPSSNPISGRTFLILKTKEKGSDKWMILPEVPLESEKPATIKNGRSFSITRFKTIRFKAPFQEGQNPYATATILVYAANGDLLLEKSFPIEIDQTESAPAG